MSQEKYSTKKREFQHLTMAKRAQIEILLRQGEKKTTIARLLNISRSTLYNELKRGTVEQLDTNLVKYTRYFHDAGQRVYEERRRNSRKPYKAAKAHEFLRYAEEQILENGLSPDAICGQTKKEGRFTETVSTKTLYNYIDQGLLAVKNIDLPLRVKRKVKSIVCRKNRRIFGDSIEERPELINSREEFGHWEIDTIVGKKGSKDVLLTLDERRTRKRHIIKISSRTAEAVAEGINQLRGMYGDCFRKVFRTITSDNGSEFSELPKLLPETRIFYTHPYSSFERGTNEKQNSLVRRFFPKGTDFEAISVESIQFVEDWINNLPRKLLNYSTANELFSDFLNSVLFDIAI